MPPGSAALIGSSPRMRGTPGQACPTLYRHRFIPAHAGNTPAYHLPIDMRPVHPRACGEHEFDPEPDQSYFGSSPRMRGTPTPAISVPPGRRFIPAHAGNTRPGTADRKKAPVHPRACGEHLWFLPLFFRLCGSSPRMRGTLSPAFCRHCRLRFIPAHAGNTTLHG